MKIFKIPFFWFAKGCFATVSLLSFDFYLPPSLVELRSGGLPLNLEL